MRTIEAHAVVDANGTLILQMPQEVAPGKYYVEVRMCNTPIDENITHSNELSIMMGRCTPTWFTLFRDGKAIVPSVGYGYPSVSLYRTVVDYMKSEHHLLIGDRTAEKVILEIGSAAPLESEVTMVVRGRDTVTGSPNAIEITSMEIRNTIQKDIELIIISIVGIIRNVSKESSTDLSNCYIVLRGEFGNLRKLDQRLQEATGMSVRVEE
ncbi:MAG: rod shape-determining protein [Anaerolineae bacterium]|nr:rod shape-determining protein [Anaerolineae bacterium]